MGFLEVSEPMLVNPGPIATTLNHHMIVPESMEALIESWWGIGYDWLPLIERTPAPKSTYRNISISVRLSPITGPPKVVPLSLSVEPWSCYSVNVTGGQIHSIAWIKDHFGSPNKMMMRRVGWEMWRNWRMWGTLLQFLLDTWCDVMMDGLAFFFWLLTGAKMDCLWGWDPVCRRASATQ